MAGIPTLFAGAPPMKVKTGSEVEGMTDMWLVSTSTKPKSPKQEKLLFQNPTHSSIAIGIGNLTLQAQHNTFRPFSVLI